MSISTRIFIEKRQTKKDGTKTLKLRVTVNRRLIEISTGYSVPLKDWNEKTQTVRSSCKTVSNVTRLNVLLQKKKADTLSILHKLEELGELSQLSTKEIKKRIDGKNHDPKYVLAFFDVVITELEVAGKVGNARVYKNVQGSISNFLNGKDIPLTNITHSWLKKYDIWFMNKGNSTNGLSFNLRTLRALINKAIKRKIISKDVYPFDEYTIKKEKTRKRAIKDEEIKAIISYEPKSPKEQRAKDYFLISFYLMGISFVDLAYLTIENIKQGRINYRRRKTKQLHSIKIVAPLQSILDKYLTGKEGGDFILPIIKHTVDKKLYTNVHIKEGAIKYSIKDDERSHLIPISDELNEHIMEQPVGLKRSEFLLNLVVHERTKRQYMDIRNELRLFNNCMKVIGKSLGIDHKITSYVARHSFASIAKQKQIPIPVISALLGHENLQTTEIYLTGFDSDVMDKFNEQIVGA